MKLILPLITFLMSNLWGFYGGIPFTTIEPSCPLIERSIGSLQLASTLNTLAEIGQFFANKTVPEPPTIPLPQPHPSPTVDPGSLPRIGKRIIKNPIDRTFNWVRSRYFPRPLSPSPSPKTDPEPLETPMDPKDTGQGYRSETIVYSATILGLLLMQVKFLCGMANDQRRFRNKIIDVISSQTRELYDIRTGLGHMYDQISSAQDELQQLRRSFRGVERLPQDLTRLSRELEEVLRAHFAEIGQNRFIDVTQMPSETASETTSVEKEKFWKDFWTDIKDELKRTAEGFQSGMNVFLDLHMGVLTTVADAFQQQYQRSSAAMAAELARAFVAQLKNEEVDIKIETSQSDGQDEGSGSGSQDGEGDLMNIDDLEANLGGHVD